VCVDDEQTLSLAKQLSGINSTECSLWKTSPLFIAYDLNKDKYSTDLL